MSTTHDHVVSTINHLLETLNDGEHGYKKAAEDVKNENLKMLFNNYAEQRYRFGHELKEEVRRLGGDPDKTESIASAVHRTWIDIKSAFTNGGEEAVLAECQRGDGYAVDAYKKAIDDDLPMDTKQVISRQYESIVEARNKVETLKNAYDDKK